MINRYSRFGDRLSEQDTRRTINPALLDLEDYVAGVGEVDHYYVSTAFGSDLNDGKSTSKRVKTVSRLREILPQFASRSIFVHFGPGTYSLNEFNGGIRTIFLNLNSSLYLYGDGCEGVEGDGFTQLASGTIAVGSTDIILQTSGLGVADYSGKTIEILSGVASEYRRTIWSNTATQIDIGARFNPAVPTTGDTYRILEPNVNFQFDTTSTSIPLRYSLVTLGLSQGQLNNANEGVNTSTSLICWINVKFSRDSTGAESDISFLGAHQFYGIEQVGGNAYILGVASIGESNLFGNFGGYTLYGDTPLDDLSDHLVETRIDFVAKWHGWGWGTPQAISSTIRFYGGFGKITGVCGNFISLFDKAWVWAVRGVRTRTGCVVYNSDLYVSAANSQFTSSGTAVTVSGRSGVIFNGNTISGATGINVIDGSVVSLKTATSVTGTTRSLNVVAGHLNFDSTTVLTGDTRVSTGTVLNMQTGAVVSGTQAPASYSAAGVGFSNGVASISRIS